MCIVIVTGQASIAAVSSSAKYKVPSLEWGQKWDRVGKFIYCIEDGRLGSFYSMAKVYIWFEAFYLQALPSKCCKLVYNLF